MNAFVPAAPGTALRREQDLAMMKDPDRWPVWPKLPLKRYDHDQDTGFLFNGSLEDNDTKPRVYLTTIFHKVDDETPFIEYTDLDGVVDDGWTVD